MTDPNMIRNQYVTGSSIRVRQETYERYSVPKIDYPTWVLDRITWRGNERVLDVGCGAGTYYQPLKQHYPNIHYYGIDLYTDNLMAHGAHGKLVQAHAQKLPFPDGYFDVVMANHMMFHLPDQDAALREFRRVLKPQGVMMASTNSIHTMPEFQHLMRRAIVLLGVPSKAQAPPLPHHSFSLENGAQQMAKHFYAVVRYDLPGVLIFPSLEPVMNFLESTRELREGYLPPEVTWDDVMLVMREQIAALLGHFGELTINKVSGVLIASNEGGFIHEFVDKQNGKQ